MAPRRNRKHVTDPNLCRLPGKGSGPIHVLPLGRGYTALRDAYFEFLRTLSPPIEHRHSAHDPSVPTLPNVGYGYPTGWDATYHLMTPQQQEAVSNLYVLIGECIQSAYGYGLDYGQDLLSQLARGELRVGDFEHPHRKCKNCGRTLPTGGKICRYCHNEEEEPSEDQDKPEQEA